MKLRILTTGALTAAIAMSSMLPALADGAASTRNIILGGAAAAIGVTNYNHKKRIKQQEMQEQARRQSAYRDWYYKKYGQYPTDQQFRDWYYRTYGVRPS
ncbi:MAG: hypothetical protein JO101_04915 [Candidatus Eremiobacteraeota bacterium]|nr:hypothetical protein [Candidatus Eremiobacteraeota bacterium]MBV8354641.1 hypothetical protein [Candidatus Eremiobacteraeota bacterium]